ncbi:MAG: hypothetical protein A2268_05225 [Candidatus Raymondbacteria bacterium RifOxyA12_full_50_37]|uniref:Uncharacterized protein n=1 Tax=Candidatus Raymondbacteria bacterium RIFOXYD12_FULL_49_13 TaxID=1817890 RepID=A0A1F7EZE5_UNCRA|nr:MAG: hypothetical protein A2268_05225 [Candidatus Raymondbacteria bacterium RifOxyA12_full_50_37]OGJ88969.1 MAG: hypothetical protein A2248_02460 [Candidatus Raymondbacteria bacterium RIFOXYA2_FULL_49_16]OGJ96997.1 MAG: hypothetical protein A2453_03880 [Candidatus Raymondbacteria bacterium RIFOXYC2_FULL_50_21]OGJ99747.1 MAG: hypothetical protein A2519_12440 [Candidatus Raymondbacteria bacterium RIFOXYD12_FULL_49_13]OGK02542.1 MAG: hypothetical protein A2487_14945 [Candidatus Raymondbacteria 
MNPNLKKGETGGIGIKHVMKKESFLSNYRKGTPDSVQYVPLNNGFLYLQYDCEGEIEQAAYVRKNRDEPGSNDLQLYFMWGNDMVTFKTENGLSGEQWSNGYADFGTVYETDDAPSQGKKIDLDVWISQCLEEMERAAPGAGLR